MVFAPANPLWKVKPKFAVITFPLILTVELDPLRVHWLFCRLPPLPGDRGPIQAVAASFRR